MTDDTRLQRYAEIVVRVGLNIQSGQELLLRADLDHAEVARAVTEQAYLAGASRVTVEYLDPHVRRSTLQHAPMEKLTEAPGWRLAQIREAGEQGAAILTLTGSADPHLFDDIAPERLAAMPLELANLSRQVMLGGDVSWAVVAAPNPGWAEQVFGAPDVERLWEAVSVAMRLDSPDVVKEWREHSERLQARARALEALDLDTIRYHGEGTDLTAGLVPGCRWVSGSIASKSGVEFMPNLPTEEVFTSPDRRRADGTIRLTRPLVMPRAGVVFHNTLYDENAGCHVAWGQGFPMAVPDGQSLGSEELFDLGINRSAVHTDVVVGGPGVDVTGTTRDGREVAIIADDAWVLPVG